MTYIVILLTHAAHIPTHNNACGFLSPPGHLCSKCHPYITNTSLCADHVGNKLPTSFLVCVTALLSASDHSLSQYVIIWRTGKTHRSTPTTCTPSSTFHVLGGTLDINVSQQWVQKWVKRDYYRARSEILAVVLPNCHNCWEDGVIGITVPGILKDGWSFKML